MNPLDELAVKYGTDKGPLCHHYTTDYHELLKDKRESATAVLEFGVHRRNWEVKQHEYPSIMMWHDYFAKALIIGVDQFDFSSMHSRVNFMKADQSSLLDLKALVAVLEERNLTFDLMLDDASHKAADQKLTLLMLWPLLKVGGIYIVEDLNCKRGDKEEERFVKVLSDWLCDAVLSKANEVLGTVFQNIHSISLIDSKVSGPMSSVALVKG